MDDALGDALVVEVGDLLAQDEVLEQRRPAQAGLQRILVVGDRHALVGRQMTAGRVHPHAVERSVGPVDPEVRLAAPHLRRAGAFLDRAAPHNRVRRPVAHSLRRPHLRVVRSVLGRLRLVERLCGGELLGAGLLGIQRGRARRRRQRARCRRRKRGRAGDGAKRRSEARVRPTRAGTIGTLRCDGLLLGHEILFAAGRELERDHGARPRCQLEGGRRVRFPGYVLSRLSLLKLIEEGFHLVPHRRELFRGKVLLDLREE